MVSAAALALFVLTHGQAVAARVETARLAKVCSSNPASASCKTTVDPSKMPTPSLAWRSSLASFVYVDPFFSGMPKYELVHFMVYAAAETLYDDEAGGDGGKSGCSLGVRAEYWGVTVDELKADPGLCIGIARKVMKYSFAQNRAHPMAQYAGSAFDANSIRIADERDAIINELVAKLPPIVEPSK